MTDPEDDATRRKGHVAVIVTYADGAKSRPRFANTWEAAFEFLNSAEFKPGNDARTITIKRLAPRRRDTPGSHWTPTAEQAAAIEQRAQREHECRICQAAPGEPCIAPEPGRTVHGPRFIAARKAEQADIARRDPELASLPRIPRAEIEKCRRPDGNYSFPRAWFAAHGLPFPPPPGWRAAVERDND